MAPQTPSVLTLKQNFLTGQTRLLSQPLQPSRAWRRSNEAADNEENNQRVSEKAVDDALFRLNQTLQQHSKRVYPPQATRHIVEQIDQLYLATGDRHNDSDVNGDDEEEWRFVGADFVKPGVISSLPPTWEPEREATAQPLEAKRYVDLVERLQDLSARKEEVETRVKRLRKMKALLEPFNVEENDDSTITGVGSNSAGANGVQENLVQRDGEMEKELERMRMLLVRVGDKVSRLKEREGSNEDLFGDGDRDAMIVDDVEVQEQRKADALLESMR
ncbi:hypothetical protein N0V93_000745 [Gnomoniopsis smithogilvyi]|uniref:Kinetochore protein fta4 n=1 Tax=Gnomoniopsis smithogilvyi TaxID=1191159 RepID=A0A9W8Z2F2_9PEZI|nr:hypothetical protein N0V93_000745 [Gnomoniopsis smithogilvyi]